MRLKVVSTAAIAALCIAACSKKGGKSSSSDNPNPEQQGPNQEEPGPNKPGTVALGTVNFAVAAVNGLDITNSQVSATSGQAKPGNLAISGTNLTGFSLAGDEVPDPATDAQGELNGITSGPPDGFKVKIKKIIFKSDKADAKVFESADGVEVAIDGAKVDLSKVIAAVGADGDAEGAVALKVPPGTYSEIEVVYFQKAEIKGCVEGLFDSGPANKKYVAVPPGSTGISIGDPIPEYTGEHKYCTQTAKSLYNVTSNTLANFFFNEDFESKTGSEKEAQWMSIELGRYPTWDFQPQSDGPGPKPHSTDVTAEYAQGYKLLAPVEVKEGESIDLTMVIDMNRILRYNTGAYMNNWGTNKNQASPDYPAVRNPAFFFDSVFSGSTFVFADKPGGIYGYEVLSLACQDDKHTVDGLASTCDDSYRAVETWMTLITDGTGAPLSMLIQPKDDTRFTTLAGSHSRGSNWIFPASDGESADIRYTMGDNFVGTIFGFPADLEENDPVAKGAAGHPANGQFVLKWDLHKIGDQYDGKPVYPSNVTQGPPNGDQQGVAIFWRRL